MKLYLIDLDGTLIDSLWFWEKLAFLYLEKRQETPPENLMERLESKTLPDACELLCEYYGWDDSPEDVYQDLMNMISHYYREVFEMKKGAKDYLSRIYEEGHKLVLFTTTLKPLASDVLKRFSLYDYFSDFIFVEELDLRKDNPEMYRWIADKYGFAFQDIVLLEDSWHAMEPALDLGITVYGMLDRCQEKDECFIVDHVDGYFKGDFNQFIYNQK